MGSVFLATDVLEKVTQELDRTDTMDVVASICAEMVSEDQYKDFIIQIHEMIKLGSTVTVQLLTDIWDVVAATTYIETEISIYQMYCEKDNDNSSGNSILHRQNDYCDETVAFESFG